MLSMVPKAATPPATLYVGLFVGASETAPPPSAAVLSTYTDVAEAAYDGYVRQPLTASQWGAIGAKTTWGQTGRGTTGAQVAFPAATAPYETQINGFFLATEVGHGAEIGLWYSNFDDEVGIAAMAIGDIIKITPTWSLLP